MLYRPFGCLSYIKNTSKFFSTKAIVPYLSHRNCLQTVTPTSYSLKQRQQVQQAMNFFQDAIVSKSRDTIFHFDAESPLQYAAIEWHGKQNSYRSVIYFKQNQEGINLYKQLVKRIDDYQIPLKCIFNPARCNISLSCDYFFPNSSQHHGNLMTWSKFSFLEK